MPAEAHPNAHSGTSRDDNDTSDSPPLTGDFWTNAVRNSFYKPIKTATTVRVDSDVLVRLQPKGKGYQTRINANLRKAMLKEIGEA